MQRALQIFKSPHSYLYFDLVADHGIKLYTPSYVYLDERGLNERYRGHLIVYSL